ncbi:ATP-dependent DNA helicase RecG [Deferribacter thermophilus]|uniref:ATP-dependent DNA helicase RecG n=1 Tax=Deferribacter thermophilus TaxID=53573 RepID=UPI003C234BC4
MTDKNEILKIISFVYKNPNSFVKNYKSYLNNLLKIIGNSNLSIRNKILNVLNSKEISHNKLFEIIYELNLIYVGDKNPISLNLPISFLNGVGEKIEKILNKSGIKTIEDILFNFPYKYEYYGNYKDFILVKGTLLEKEIFHTKYGKKILLAKFNCKNTIILGVWYSFNKNYPLPLLIEKKTFYLYGKKGEFNNLPAIIHPIFLKEIELNQIIPVYSIPSKIPNKTYYKIVENAFYNFSDNLIESIPNYLLLKYNYPDIKNALKLIHFPENIEVANKISMRTHPAFERFVYEELFYLQIGLLANKRLLKATQGIKFDIDLDKLKNLKRYLPFELTNSQKKVLAEIFNDMKKIQQMNRLIQGDVGSGKTIVAFIAGIVAVFNNYQVAIIAPTEVLAEQHYNNFTKTFGDIFTKCLITGSTPKKEKEILKDKIANGEIDFIFGTHALIQEDVNFKALGLAIIDEQHRFGVEQRKILIDKGYNPDILLMSATPIPRTLALTFYGDLDISIIDEMPPGRKPVITKAYSENRILEVYDFVKKEILKGNKAYFIYPLIDESDKVDLKAATISFEKIKDYFGDDKVVLLHGKMKSEEKKKVLDEFKHGDKSILVSTTVIEVGIDVPDATIMVIENAERFGLSQLHQLRGRVGRNDKQSYCLLVYSNKISEDGKKRINAMVKYNNGFKISEIDLELRGPGDFFGTKQSGLPEFRFSNIIRDIKVLKNARKDAEEILKEDPFLSLPKNKIIKEILLKKWKKGFDYLNVG